MQNCSTYMYIACRKLHVYVQYIMKLQRFAGGSQTANFVKVFSLDCFPLCGIHHCKHLPHFSMEFASTVKRQWGYYTNTKGVLEHTSIARRWLGKGTEIDVQVFIAYLLKLVYPEDAPCVSAVGPHLLSETRRYPSVLPGQVLWLHPLVTMKGTDWLLARSYQVLLLNRGVLGYLAALTDHLKG